MTNDEVNLSFSDTNIKLANAINLTNKMGKLRIGKANELITTSSYSDTDIGLIRQTALISVSFSKRFRMDRLPETLTNLDMAVSYLSILLPVDRNSNYNFNVSMINGGFTYPTNGSVVLMNQSATDLYSRLIKKYSGTVGKGTGSKVQLVGTYITVGFK
ncbi:hypothetical protein [Spirosoma agri]|uniref:Uncharacterized protein n=1 Tax=Spirosoma agri TaxID=1987381 RepID=A0A6M0ICW3_9BACT|nr:hypothetical protein [Spirosoma agri]NEU65958.1 hypothetical protein [Spirosoma agri]